MEKKNDLENLFSEIIVDNFPNLEKDREIQIEMIRKDPHGTLKTNFQK